MKRFLGVFTLLAAFVFTVSPAFSAEQDKKPASTTGSLLHGTVYKQTGAVREGTITLRMSWSLPTTAPALRYDFSILSGTVEDTMYKFMLSDVASLEFLPQEGDRYPINVVLKSGKSQKIYPATEKILGKVDLFLKQADIITEGYGNSIVLGGDVTKVVFSTPKYENAAAVTDDLGKAIETASRDGLADADLITVIETLQKKLKEADRKHKSR